MLLVIKLNLNLKKIIYYLVLDVVIVVVIVGRLENVKKKNHL